MPDLILEWPSATPQLPTETEVQWSTASPWISGVAEIVDWSTSGLSVVIVAGIPAVVQPPGPDIIVTFQGPPGIPGGSFVPLVYALVAVSSWNQVHAFPYLPDVRLIDAAREAVDIAVEYPDATHVSITFPVPFTGTVVLS